MGASIETRATTTFGPANVTTAAPAARVASVDVLRGIVVLVMIFVNDVASVAGAPAWMKHVSPPTADGMTFVDVVFPAFLFMVGVAIPLSIGRRLDAGEATAAVWRSILARVATLLAIGVLMVNTESIARDGVVPPPVWSFLMYVGVLLVWSTTRARMNDEGNRGAAMVQRVAGIGLLVALVLLYRGNGTDGFVQLRPQWWGILGLIGWAYLVGCAAYTVARRELGALIGIAALLYLVFLADAAGGFFAWAQPVDGFVDFGSMLGAHGAITVTGVALGSELSRSQSRVSPESVQSRAGVSPESSRTHAARLRWALLFGAALFVAGQLLHTLHAVHPAFIYNKIAATPAWCLVSSAYTVWLWALIYWLVDVRGWSGWTALVKPAGEHPLLAYVLPSLFYYTLWTVVLATGMPDVYFGLGASAGVGIVRAVVLAFGIVWVTGWLARRGLRFRV